MAFGRGLASLIPSSGNTPDDIDELLNEIEQEEVAQQETASVASVDSTVEGAEKQAIPARKLNVLEDFSELEKDDEELAPPERPNVTPITLDPDMETNLELEREEEIIAEQEKQQLEDIKPVENIVPVAPAAASVHASRIANTTPIMTPIMKEEKAEKQEMEKTKELEKVVAAEQVQDTKELERTLPSFGEGDGDIWDKHEDQVQHIPIGDVQINPLQPRRNFDPADMEELKDSIKRHGILQPLVVRRLSGDQGYELIAGERRLRASRDLGWDKVPAVVRRDVKSDQSRLVFALIENIQRENLNSIEEALAYKQLNEEYGLSHEEIGERVGKSRVAVTNMIRLLQLPVEIQRALGEGKITVGHAKAILMIPDEEKQIRFFHHLLDEGLTVRKAETRARRIQRQMKVTDPMRRKRGGRNPMALKYTPALEERYGHDVYIKFLEDKNRYEVTFKAYNDTEIDQLVNRLLGIEDLPSPDQDKDVLEGSDEEGE